MTGGFEDQIREAKEQNPEDCWVIAIIERIAKEATDDDNLRLFIVSVLDSFHNSGMVMCKVTAQQMELCLNAVNRYKELIRKEESLLN